MKVKLKCFISYNHRDNDINNVQSFISYLKKFSNDKIDFFIDENLSTGGDLSKFMKLINEVDSVIVLLTPEYKKKAEERILSGVYDEYKLIIERLENEKQKKIDPIDNNQFIPSFSLIPIVFARNHSESCPVHLNNLKSLDFSDFHVRDNGRLISALESKYYKLFQKICSELLALQSINRPSVDKDFKILLQKLFFETKHDNLANSFLGQEMELYVKTRSFNDLRDQSTYFFLGRKGSGKSTLAPLLYLLDGENYKEHIEINIDGLNLEYLINLIINKSIGKDIGIIISYTEFFKYVWEVFIFVNSFKIICNEYKSSKLTLEQEKFIPLIEQFLDDIGVASQDKVFNFIQKTADDELNSLFQWCLSCISIQCENAIKNARIDEPLFHFDINNSITRKKLMLSIFSDKLLYSFYSIIKLCKRNFFISFDGFDTMFEKFRIETNRYEYSDDIRIQRNRLEVGFLEGFLTLINNIKSNKKLDPFYQRINLCVTVPKDRFFEIKNEQRDSYIYIDKFHEIKWSGIELSIMLRKRLEILYGYRSDRNDLPHYRLLDVLKNTIKKYPLETNISIDAKQFTRDTFLNIVRHSFWRPREILIYYSKLIAVTNDLNKRNITPDNFAVSKIISETTFEIINNEFISEFKNYCLNIKSILNQFKDSNQIMRKDELELVIKSINFELVEKVEKDTNKKIEFLFEIGFMGIEVSKKLMESYKILIGDVFCFNTSNSTFEILKASEFNECKFIIHPIFCEFLSLNTNNQDRLTIDITWDYLKEQDVYVRP